MTCIPSLEWVVFRMPYVFRYVRNDRRFKLASDCNEPEVKTFSEGLFDPNNCYFRILIFPMGTIFACIKSSPA
jgi:hypothetical protein